MTERSYVCSTGEQVTETEIWNRFDDGSWVPYCWDDESRAEWVKTGDGVTVKLMPLDPPRYP